MLLPNSRKGSGAGINKGVALADFLLRSSPNPKQIVLDLPLKEWSVFKSYEIVMII